MIGLIRIIGLAFVALTIVYVCVSFYSRAVRKEKLGQWWEEGGREGDREAYIREGLKEYDKSLRRRLILGVYLIPTVIVTVIVYLVNYA
jgi:Ca2+/Na+ antiporter